jgi:hypothetical protein
LLDELVYKLNRKSSIMSSTSAAMMHRRPLTVYQLGGRMLGYRHLYRPPAHIRQLRGALLNVLLDEFDITNEPTGCADESPAQVHLTTVCRSLQAGQPNEVLILHGLQGIFETVDALCASQEDFPNSAITLVGTKYLLGADGPLGDPEGERARQAIHNAMAGGLRGTGIYVASGGEAIPFAEAELVMAVQRRESV